MKNDFKQNSDGKPVLTVDDYVQLATDARNLNAKKAILVNGIQDHPYSETLWARMAVTASKLKHDLEAEQAFGVVLRMNPDSPEMLMEYGRFSKKTKQYARAEQTYAKLIAIEGYNKFNLSALGDVYHKQGLYNLARGCFGYALTIDKDDQINLERLRDVEGITHTAYAQEDFSDVSTRIAKITTSQQAQKSTPKGNA